MCACVCIHVYIHIQIYIQKLWIYICVQVFVWTHVLNLSGTCLGVELLGHGSYGELPDCFLKWLHHFTFLPEVYEGSDFSVSFVSTCYYLFLILVGLKYLIAVLVFISLMAVWCPVNFNVLIGYCMSLEKCMFRSFAYFKIVLSFLLVSCKRFLCNRDTGPLSRYMIYRYFLPFLDCLFTFFLMSFEAQKFKFGLSPSYLYVVACILMFYRRILC